MSPFDAAAILLTVAAAAGYVNHRFLRLPATSGTLAVALSSSLAVLLVATLLPGHNVQERASAFLDDINFNETLMRGFLSFLLFAAALHVDFEGLLRQKWTIGLLSTVGVLISTVAIGVLVWAGFRLLGVPMPLPIAMVFGALISPTDPIAVVGLLRDLRAPESLETQIAGESLFNDGVGVVVFLAVLSMAGLSGDASHAPRLDSAGGVLAFFVREVAGGIVLGLVSGFAAYRLLKTVDEPSLELLITLSLVVAAYSVAFPLGVSGPIAVVVAGVFIGNPGRKFAMSRRTCENVDAFWTMLDYVLNSVLFLMLGLVVFSVHVGWRGAAAALLAIPIALAARAISVLVPVTALRRSGFIPGIVPILTWSGLRGGISVALALSLPPFPARDTVLAATYAVVVFTILVQGLTVRRLLVHYRVGVLH